jgi:cytochrome c553
LLIACTRTYIRVNTAHELPTCLQSALGWTEQTYREKHFHPSFTSRSKPRIMLPLNTMAILIIASLFIFSCDDEKKVTTLDANVNDSLAQNPPLAEEIFIKQLDKPRESGNVLVSVQLPGIRTRQHAVMVGDDKLVLHDDGDNGDEKPGDGVFSIILQEDMNAFLRQTAMLTEGRTKNLQGRPLIKFVNRHAVLVPPNRIREIRLDSAALLRGIRFPIDFFTAGPDPRLRDRSLMITDLGVVRDKTRTFDPCAASNAGNPNGAWTFNKLITDMVNNASTGVSVENFVREWLDNWMNSRTVNGDVIDPRTSIFNVVIRPWIIRSNPGANPNTGNWKTFTLDMSKAPFKLEAIVNRIDLRGNIGYSLSNAGEGRFVFSVTDANCNGQLFTIILEYGIPKKTCKTLKAYAAEWIALKTMTPGSVQYNNALEAITNQFAAVNAAPGRPNGSALNQLRTNEVALNQPWELREFHIDANTHLLTPATVAREPAEKFNRNGGAASPDLTTLAMFVNSNEADIIAQRHNVPATFNGAPFLGSKALTRTIGHFWDGATTSGPGFINSDSARHFISLNTCSGCHGGEGKTSVGNRINDPAGVNHNPFLQIAPHGNGVKATLAAFLTGEPSDPERSFRVSDPANRPAGSPVVWAFNDLERRAQDLEEFVGISCTNKLGGLIHALKFKPLNMVH